MTPSEQTAAIRRYFELMSASDIDGIIEPFDDDAYVLSPFLGKMAASDFFKKLGNASNQSTLTVFDVLLGENGDSAAAHFEYDWILASGEQIIFQEVDYDKVEKLRGMNITLTTSAPNTMDRAGFSRTRL